MGGYIIRLMMFRLNITLLFNTFIILVTSDHVIIKTKTGNPRHFLLKTNKEKSSGPRKNVTAGDYTGGDADYSGSSEYSSDDTSNGILDCDPTMFNCPNRGPTTEKVVNHHHHHHHHFNQEVFHHQHQHQHQHQPIGTWGATWGLGLGWG